MHSHARRSVHSEAQWRSTNGQDRWGIFMRSVCDDGFAYIVYDCFQEHEYKTQLWIRSGNCNRRSARPISALLNTNISEYSSVLTRCSFHVVQETFFLISNNQSKYKHCSFPLHLMFFMNNMPFSYLPLQTQWLLHYCRFYISTYHRNDFLSKHKFLVMFTLMTSQS